MNKHLKFFFVFFIALCSLFSCKDQKLDIHVQSLRFDNNSGEIFVGEYIKIENSILPENATNKTIIWHSEDENIATISNGEVKGINAGTTTIIATSEDGAKTASFKITVNISAREIKILSTITTLKVNKTFQMEAIVLPETASNKKIKWETSNNNIASITEGGIVSTKSYGEVIIIAKSFGGGKSAEYKLTITNKIEVESIELNINKKTLYIGDTFIIEPTIIPDDAYNQKVIYSSDNEKVALVDNNGRVKAEGEGICNIILTSVNNKTASIKINVNAPRIIEVESIQVAVDEIELWVGETFFVDAKITPDDAVDQTLTCSSSDEEVAIIDEFAEISATGEGECTIQLKSVNGITAQIEVTVKEKKVEHIIGKWHGKKIYYIQDNNRKSAEELIEEFEIPKNGETLYEKKIREGNLANVKNDLNIFVKQWYAEFKANNKGTGVYFNKIYGDEDRLKHFFLDWRLNDNKTYNFHYTVNDPKLPEDQKVVDANEIDAILTLNPNNKKLASFIFVKNRDAQIKLEVQIEKDSEMY